MISSLINYNQLIICSLQRCGRKICDDYEPFHQEAASIVFSRLEDSLKAYPSVATSPSSESSEGPGSQAATQAWKLLVPSFLKALVASLTPSLPQHKSSSPADPARLGVCPQPATTDPRRGTHTFLLLCLPFMRTAIKLLQLEMCTIYSDREFFRALAHHYSASRGRTRWARLRKVQSLKFVEVRTDHRREAGRQTKKGEGNSRINPFYHMASLV